MSLTWAATPPGGIMLTAACALCGHSHRVVVDTRAQAEACAVDHRCGTSVIGPVWTVQQPPAARSERARAAA